ncbi:MAG: hypothetical protein KA802_18415 [Saprospiraceae bacterium]|jgi:hypothetical protein|nr:hypothetical protein [Saprospiraceae bacterium]
MRKSTIVLIGLFVSAVITGLVLWLTAEPDRIVYQSYTERWVDFGQPIHSAADVYTLDGLPYKLVSQDDSSIILRGASLDGIICTYKDSTMHLPNTFTTEQMLVSKNGSGEVLKRVLLTVLVEKNNQYRGQSLVHVMIHDIGWPSKEEKTESVAYSAP